MTDKEYAMTFGEWCNNTKGMSLALNEYGEILWNDRNKASAVEQWHDLWCAERKAYRLEEKNLLIVTALEGLKKQGIECKLCSYQNGHIKAKTVHGRILSYYATTGTIAGYNGTMVEGLDKFIELCKK